MMIEDNSACIPVAPPPPIKPVEQPPFPVGDEFIKKKEVETTPEEKTASDDDKEESFVDNGAVYGPLYPKYGDIAKFLQSI